MPDRKTVQLVGIDDSTLPALRAALDALGYEGSEGSPTIAVVMVRSGATDDGVMTIAEFSCPVIAVVDAEDRAAAKAATAAGARGVLDLPLRRSAVAAQVELALAAAAHQQRMQRKAQLLERTLKARSIIEKATQVLATIRGITQPDAYEELRQSAMSQRSSMAETAQTLIDGVEAIMRRDSRQP